MPLYPEGLPGSEIAIQGLSTTIVDVFVHLELQNGDSRTNLLRPEAPSVILGGREEGESSLPVSGYLKLVGTCGTWELAFIGLL